MPATIEEVLAEIKELKSWLYGKNGYEGDIPEMKKLIKNHSSRIRVLEIIVGGLIVSGGGAIGLSKLLGG